MKLLVFGGTGFLGKNLVERLVQSDCQVTLYSRPESVSKLSNCPWREKVNIITGDFALESNFEKIINPFDAVIHLISASVPSVMDPLLDIDSVIKPTLKLMDACVRVKMPKLLYFSSGGAVYGVPRRIPILEKENLNPISAYGTHKLVIEKYMLLYKLNYGLNYISVRLANPYGRGQKPFSNQGIIANVLGNYYTGKETVVYGDGSIIRDYIYIDDVLDAVEKLVHYEGSESIFNIGSGVGYSINEVIDTIEEVVNNRIIIRRELSRRQDVHTNVLDISLIKKELDWTPKIDLYTGIAKLVEFWKCDGVLLS